MLSDEAYLVVEEENRRLVTVGVLIQSATATTGMGASKESFKHFKDLMDSLSGE